ncbi:LPS export ABC transporter periplasmic protein LptC [Dasania marina]|uniref:LPS export ABC transporter periplasmic protein LptC n=1 Tax=Dasania marina TaxID=471499 RepID=UPI00035D135A|nr:LPS export ABC transporter periplasmic protein LptC [Dasania marina]
MTLLRRKQKHFVITSIALALLLMFLWLYTESGSTPSFSKKATPKEPEIFMRDIHSQRFNAEGQLAHTLTAESLNNYAKGKRSILQLPVMHFYTDQQLTWQITADSGIVTKQGQQVALKNNVIVLSNDQRYQLSTSALNIYPKKQIAENNLAVTITSPQGTTTATGIRTDLTQEHTLLKKNVTGHYHAAP